MTMKKIIIFADDDVFRVGSENELYRKFQDDEDYVVIPVSNIEDLEVLVSSMSVYNVLILDWEFKKTIEPNVDTQPITPYNFLMGNQLYTKVYVYSRIEIEDETKNKLIEKYGSKIKFKKKLSNSEIQENYNEVIADLSEFESNNSHMEIPFKWSKSINKCTQQIFKELEEADKNWLANIQSNEEGDNEISPSDTISLFQNLLYEVLLQDSSLYEDIKGQHKENNLEEPKAGEVAAKLFRRIIYTKRTDNSAEMLTGDIFKFSEEEYGILMTPECDLVERNKAAKDSGNDDKALTFLVFKKSDIDQKIVKLNSTSNESKQSNQLNNLRKQFNNNTISCHFLPSFPYTEEIYTQAAYIDFKSALRVFPKNEVKDKERKFKLNSPYIHQLRQRYLAFLGRYGVPALPQKVIEEIAKTNAE